MSNKQLSGQVNVIADGKEYAIAFDLGAIVGASSPQVADAAVRIALTNHLISKIQVNDLSRRIAAAPERDEIDVIAETTRLSPEHVVTLRRKVIAQRAARTFSLESGEFTVEDQITLATVPGIALDVRPVIYLGARIYVTAPAMLDALRVFGDAYMLRREAEPTLEAFGFTEEVEKRILTEVRMGTSLPELEAAHRDIDPRDAQALIYALMSVGAAEAQAAPAIPRAGTATITQRQTPLQRAAAASIPPRITRESQPFISRTSSTDAPIISRTSTSPASIRGEFDDGSATPAAMRAASRSTTPPVGRATTPPPMASGTRTGSSPVLTARTTTPPPMASGTQGPAPSRTATPTRLGTNSPTGNPSFGRASTGHPAITRTATIEQLSGRTPTPAQPALGRAPTGGNPAIARTTTVRKTKALIAARSILIEQGADHFALLGLPFDAPQDIVRTTYLNLSRQLHPDKLAELGVDDSGGIASRLFSQMGHAFNTLTDPMKRTEYMASLLRPDVALPAAPIPPRTKTSEEAQNEAAESFKRGESALRRDEPIEACLAFAKAVELVSTNPDYQAMLGWAQFCAATDKAAAAPKTRPSLERAIQKSEKPVRARFLLGRMERMLGRDREALYHFQQVIDLQANHAEALSEIRAIEARQRLKR